MAPENKRLVARAFIDNAQLFAAASAVACNRALIGLGIVPRPDGWRRAAGLVLAGECSTFVLASFGLRAPIDRAATDTAIRDELSSELILRCSVRPVGIEHRAEPSPCPDAAIRIDPWTDGSGRFVPPDVWPRTDNTAGALPLVAVVCRLDGRGRCDLWMRFNHAAIDGVPAQAVLSRIRSRWGSAEVVTFPTPEAFAPLERPRPSPGRDGLAECQAFVDFSPLTRWRARLNAAGGTPVPLSAALLWCLSRHPRWSAKFLGSTVEVPASALHPSGVGVVVLRPGDFQDPRAYAAAFQRAIDATRRRATPAQATLDAIARLSPRTARRLLLHALCRAPSAFGSGALTMLRDAEVFGAPIADAGHDDGFMAIGRIDLPTIDARRVGCLCVKGPAGSIADVPSAVRAALADCDQL